MHGESVQSYLRVVVVEVQPVQIQPGPYLQYRPPQVSGDRGADLFWPVVERVLNFKVEFRIGVVVVFPFDADLEYIVFFCVVRSRGDRKFNILNVLGALKHMVSLRVPVHDRTV